LAKNW